MTTQQEAGGRRPAELVGERIHLLMWRAKISQADMARNIGITQSTLSKKLRGIVPMTVEELVAIAGVVGTDPGNLLPRLDSNQQPFGFSFPLVRRPHLRVVQ